MARVSGPAWRSFNVERAEVELECVGDSDGGIGGKADMKTGRENDAYACGQKTSGNSWSERNGVHGLGH